MGKTTCEACKKRCKGQAIKVSEKGYFHLKCFTCTECQKQLSVTAFFVHNNHRYCTEDFHRLFGTKCHLCHKFIEGDVVTVAGNTCHQECIICSKCRKNIEAGSKVAVIGTELWCQKCISDSNSAQTPVSKELLAETAASSLLLNESSQKPQEIPVRQNEISSPDSGSGHTDDALVKDETGTEHEDLLNSPGLLSPASATSGYKSDISGDQGTDQRDYGLPQNINGRSSSVSSSDSHSSSKDAGNISSNFGKFYQTSFLNKQTGFQRGPSLNQRDWKKPQHYHRPDSNEFSYRKVRADIRMPNKYGKNQHAASMRIGTDPPYRPVKSQEPIQLSKLPDAQKLEHIRQMPIERDDFVAPPATAAVYPELLRGIGLHRKSSDVHDGNNENKENFGENDEIIAVDPRIEKNIDELLKITASGTAQLILEDLKKKKYEIPVLDPRNSSRSRSATVEPLQKIRYESPIFASPSRDLQRARPQFEEFSEQKHRTCYSPIGPHFSDKFKSRTLDHRNGCQSAMAVRANTFNTRPHYTLNSEFRNGYMSDTTDGYYPSSYMSYHRCPESSTPVAERSCYTPNSDVEDYDPTTGLKITRNIMHRLNVLTDGRMTPRPHSKLRKNISVGLFKEEEAARLFPYEKLRLDNPDRPPGLDASTLEQHLTDEEIERLFSMSKVEFMNLAEWKRNDLKQRVQLYDSSSMKSPSSSFG